MAVTSGALDVTPSAVAAESDLVIESVWKKTLYKHPITTGSPGLGVLDSSGPSVLLGTTDGYVFALRTSDGSVVPGWPYSTGGIPVVSTPSSIGTGTSARAFVGVGNSAAPSRGGYLALDYKGDQAWYRKVTLLPGNQGGTRGVMSSLSVGNLYSGNDVIGGSMGQMQLAMGARTGGTIPGFPWYQADTNFSTPALARIFSSTKDYIIEGGDSSPGNGFGYRYTQGGHIRILKPTGNKGGSAPNYGLVCQLNTDQVVQSSPAVGPIFIDNKIGIVVGTGVYWSGASYTNKIVAINTACSKRWTATLDGDTRSSPAIADVTGRGAFDVVASSGPGTVYALNGRTGAVMWKKSLGASMLGGPTTFQAPGGSFQYVLAATKRGLYILDGRDGSIVRSPAAGEPTLKSSATVNRDADGSIGITIAGADTVNGVASGFVEHFRVVGSSVDTVQTPGAWPMFHHDPKLSGFTKDPLTAP